MVSSHIIVYLPCLSLPLLILKKYSAYLPKSLFHFPLLFYFISNLSFNWDFAQPLYTATIPDSSPNAFNIALLNNQSSYDPVYVHNQGMYFNSNKYLVTTGRWNPNNINSITVESWIRPSETVLSGELLSFQSATNQRDVTFKFSSNNIE